MFLLHTSIGSYTELGVWSHWRKIFIHHHCFPWNFVLPYIKLFLFICFVFSSVLSWSSDLSIWVEYWPSLRFNISLALGFNGVHFLFVFCWASQSAFTIVFVSGSFLSRKSLQHECIDYSRKPKNNKYHKERIKKNLSWQQRQNWYTWHSPGLLHVLQY